MMIIINAKVPNPSRFLGQQAMVDDTVYTIVDNALLRQLVGGEYLTTLVTDMIGLFANNKIFNEDISDWDVLSIRSPIVSFLLTI
ncbi:MAG: BspA family leucine-rich repeat surface protein [Flavobacteriaceae bacterium]|nr:BspA family leucine-rich repeat surface protein [Flavobacteriaceae bacterium]MCY4266609.1 BspA family leucine-rich repeat surface protein [Flavobacteriaceae bacterium]MCY4297964.1 BspA family leucine-rich repeat surface protein [Flavobacteriaceae bacterium]